MENRDCISFFARIHMENDKHPVPPMLSWHSRYNERRSNMRYGSRKDGGNRKTSGADSSLPRIPKVVESGSGQRRVESIYCKGGKINVCIDFKNPEPLREV